MMNRREVFAATGAGAAAAVAGSAEAAQPGRRLTAPFVHHVYFWLKRPGSTEDRDKIIAGLEKLRMAPQISMSHIGVPARTPRDVVDNSYACSWLAIFESKELQDRYQSEPIHLKFVEDCAQYWERVIVYDTLPV